MSRVLRHPGVMAWAGLALLAVLFVPLVSTAFPAGDSWLTVSQPLPLSQPGAIGPHRPELDRLRETYVDWALAPAAGPTPPPYAQVTVRVTVVDPNVVREVIRVAGDDRYGTALDASSKFPSGTGTVVIATGANWPDALGGSALAGAADAPLLLTRQGSLPPGVAAEIERLGATKAYILGGTAAVGTAAENQIKGLVGTVVRLGGADRYGTARLVADETIRLLGGGYTGDALVATGSNFPDATSGSALAAALGRPILLANLAADTVYVPSATRRVLIMGGAQAVPLSIENWLKLRLGGANVSRAGGATRYETSVLVAQAGVAAGMTWDGVGIATGANFPDALAGGAMTGARNSVIVLTAPASLSPGVNQVLTANRATINTVHIFGGTAAVSENVERNVRESTGILQ